MATKDRYTSDAMSDADHNPVLPEVGVNGYTSRVTGSDLKEIPLLLRKLGGDLTLFVDQKVALLKSEIRDEARGYMRDGIKAAIGVVLGLLAFLMVNLALASFLARAFPLSLPIAYGCSFLLLGVVYAIAGAVLLRSFKAGISSRHIIPEKTVAELKRDKQWMKNELT